MFLRHDGFITWNIDGRMTGKPIRGGRRVEIPHYLSKDDGCILHARFTVDIYYSTLYGGRLEEWSMCPQ